MQSEVLCVGEVLWDALPSGLFLGGAPFNVAGHLHALGAPVAFVSRVGSDRLGEETLRRMRRNGLATGLVQVDDMVPTGFVSVDVDAAGIPTYDIVEPAAWDFIELSDALLERAGRATALVFGSLAQRNPTARATIERLYALDGLKIFDVNLRPPYDDPSVVRGSLTHANVVKLNEHELAQLAQWFALPSGLRAATEALAQRFHCETICVTRGGDGACLLREGRWTEHPGYRVEVKDTVGSGDAFLAALIAGLLKGHDDAQLLQHANLLGAHVATQHGAIPVYQPETLALILAVNRRGGAAPASADAIFFRKGAVAG